MILTLGQTIYRPFTTTDATGALAAPTVGPVAVLKRNGVDTAEAVTVTAEATGRYRLTTAIPVGWALGDQVSVRITATVGGVAKEVTAHLGTVDAAVSTRSTYAGADTAGTTTLLTRVTGAVPLAADYTAARAANLDNLNATITSRMATFVYTAPDNAGIAAAATSAASADGKLTPARLVVLDDLDAMIATQVFTVAALANAPSSGLTAGQAAQLDAIEAVTDSIAGGELAVVNGGGVSDTGVLTIRRGDSADFTFTAAEAIDDADSLWLTVKRHHGQADADAVLQLDLTGLLVLNGAAPATGQTGTLTIEDAVARTIGVTLSSAATALLAQATRLVYDVQKRTAAGVVRTVGEGTAVVTADVTRTTGAA